MPDVDGVTNLLRNGSFESWGASAPSYWTAVGTVAEETTTVYTGSSSAKLTGAATLKQDVAAGVLTAAYVQGKTFTLTVRVRKASGALGRISIADGVNTTTSGYACYTNDWPAVSLTHTASITATKLEITLETTSGSAYFDAAMLIEGYATPAFSPNPADAADPLSADTSTPATPTGLTLTAKPLTAVLTWTANSETDIAGYDLERADDAAFTTNKVAWHVDGTRYEDTLGDTTTRYYHVRAVRQSGAASSYCAAVSVTVTLIQNAHIENAAITNAKIGNLEVDSAKIANLTVGTGKIAADAVSQHVQAYSDAATDCTGPAAPDWAYYDLVSQAITVVGGVVSITGFTRLLFYSGSDGRFDYYFRILRDGTEIAWRDGNIWYIDDWVNLVVAYQDSPGAGSHTYKINVGVKQAVGSGWVMRATNKLLQLSESKK